MIHVYQKLASFGFWWNYWSIARGFFGVYSFAVLFKIDVHLPCWHPCTLYMKYVYKMKQNVCLWFFIVKKMHTVPIEEERCFVGTLILTIQYHSHKYSRQQCSYPKVCSKINLRNIKRFFTDVLMVFMSTKTEFCTCTSMIKLLFLMMVCILHWTCNSLSLYTNLSTWSAFTASSDFCWSLFFRSWYKIKSIQNGQCHYIFVMTSNQI